MSLSSVLCVLCKIAFILDGALHEVGQDGEEKGKERYKYFDDSVVCPVDHRISVVRFPSSFVHCL